jgi:hypothetical protein
MAQVSLTRLLNEIKVTESKVLTKIGSGFITSRVGKTLPLGFTSEDEVSKQLSANYQSVNDLIKLRNVLKNLLTTSNATTKFNVAGQEMTIAQAVERKRSIDLEKRLLTSMTAQFTKISNEITNVNQKVEASIDQQLQTLFGKDRKITEDDISSVANPYRLQHQAVVIDPLNLRKEIQVLTESISDFESEVDFALSEINARTLVELP